MDINQCMWVTLISDCYVYTEESVRKMEEVETGEPSIVKTPVSVFKKKCLSTSVFLSYFIFIIFLLTAVLSIF